MLNQTPMNTCWLANAKGQPSAVSKITTGIEAADVIWAAAGGQLS